MIYFLLYEELTIMSTDELQLCGVSSLQFLDPLTMNMLIISKKLNFN
jgi:hypothetical protein